MISKAQKRVNHVRIEVRRTVNFLLLHPLSSYGKILPPPVYFAAKFLPDLAVPEPMSQNWANLDDDLQ
ncbi:hypothetical protein HC62_13355 [Acetobacter tropicalis]|uniref:Uncharacterized protein n=1 Tax=Acetobacter tropicalis TaxID=104102 RepID=A0A252A4G9_9PROT|nr:hypothetical protein HC62_13355 [Acetobacter tropicalis]